MIVTFHDYLVISVSFRLLALTIAERIRNATFHKRIFNPLNSLSVRFKAYNWTL